MFSAVYITLCFIYQVDQASALPADNADTRCNFLSCSGTSFILVIGLYFSFIMLSSKIRFTVLQKLTAGIHFP